MKRFLAIALLASALMVSCADDFKYKGEEVGFGTLSFADLQISVDSEEIVMRAAEAAPGTYLIFVYDDKNTLYGTYTYNEVKSAGSISLPAGTYRVEIRSEEDVPAAKFATPIYGAVKEGIIITAGEPTAIGQVVCTLLQCKVTVDYNDDFLEMVTGDCNVEVSVSEPLNYAMTWDSANNKIKEYEREAGYFAINNGDDTTMEVKFSGMIFDEKSGESKTMKMNKTFNNIAARQWRQVKFIKKVDVEGNATFDIVINDYVEDNPLNEDLTGSETVLEKDPNAPQGDGNIKLLSVAGLNENTTPTQEMWNAAFTDDDMDVETYEMIVLDDKITTADGKQLLQFEALVPNKIKDFYIVIESEILAPMMAGMMGDAEYIDLVHDTSVVELIATIIPFPYHNPASGMYVENQTSVSFILDDAVSILRDLATDNPELNHTHTFQMNVRDWGGCTKQINLTLKVEPNSAE